MEIPTRPEELTPEWLTLALQAKGTVDRARVRSRQTEAIGQVGGITGQLVRVSLEYDIEEEGAPRSLIAKLTAPDPRVRATVHSLGMYEREVRFYQQAAGEVALRMPRCYYADLGEEGVYVLLIEDLAPACCGQEMSGASLSNAELAVRQIAQFHATWWQSPRLAEMDWLIGHNVQRTLAIYQMLERDARQQWEPFLELAGSTLPPEIASVGERAVSRYSEIASALFMQPPQTFIHRDLGLDNVFFPTAEGGVPFAVIDWQQASLGRGPYDVSTLLWQGMPPEERRAVEMELLNVYHTTLVEGGVHDYSFEQCLRDYRLTTLACLARMVYVAPKGVTEEQRRKFLDIRLPRLCAAILDLEAGDLLS